MLSDAEIASAWAAALTVWDVTVALCPPVRLARDPRNPRDPLAYIDLQTRQVVVCFELLEKMKAEESLTAILAHEIGHHVRFPHTLPLVAELVVLERELIPGLGSSLTNLFFDLQVNEVVGRTKAEDLCRVYRGFAAVAKEPPDPLFTFYLAVYEELWARDVGELSDRRFPEGMDESYPGWRAEARMFVQTFYAFDDTYLQFLYFCSVFIRYVPDPTKLSFRWALSSDVPEPGPDDLARAGQSEQRDHAIDEAKRRGWITEGEASRAKGEDDLPPIKRVTSHAPGIGGGSFRLVKEHEDYRRLVERYLIEPPPVATPPEPYLPTVLEDWEPGDNPLAIDWTQSVLTRGALAPAQPLRRELEADDAGSMDQGLPAMEVYLDTSGSMPSPGQLNFMTLAAQILAVSTCRKGGLVRGIIYSWECLLSDWMRHEDVARRFFLGYAGGGTSYPFALLRKLAKERPDVIRIVISDSDFLFNVVGQRTQNDQKADLRRLPRGRDDLAYGVSRSRLFVALLALDKAGIERAAKLFEPLAATGKFRLVAVPDITAMAQAAADLARAILGPISRALP